MAIVNLLAPAAPFLMKLGEKAAESAAEKLGEDIWEKAKKLWAKLRPKVEAKPLAQGAVQELSENPDDQEARELLAKQLAKFLTDDKALAEAITEIMQEGSPQSGSLTGAVDTSISVSGNHNLTVGQMSNSEVFPDVQGSVSIDKSRDKVSISADRGSQIAGGNATRRGSNILSGNVISFLVIGILALGAVAWMFGVRIGPQGIYLDTQGGQSPQPASPSSQPTTSP
ncbi:MAG: hypothetical protein AB4426_29665 [Xenococcaceae cyanobacterium]